MSTLIKQPLNDERWRREQFPIVRDHVFLAHAGVTALPQVARKALADYADYAAHTGQEDDEIWRRIAGARKRAADLIGAQAQEMALLGPTALGLNLVANGWPWESGDEVIYYADDYPANVYPWLALKERGVTPVPLRTERLGEVTWAAVERTLSPATRMVALASCHYLTGFRIDVDEMGRKLHERDILFCLDGIQTLGAFPTSVEHVDFLSADSHKWMLGPVGAGLFYVREAHHERLKPTLLGAWNVVSPEFIAQDHIAYYAGARRYEPGTLNIPGILAMDASLELLQDVGIDAVADRILALRAALLEALRERGFACPPCMREAGEKRQSGIISVTHPTLNMPELFKRLTASHIRASLRCSRDGTPYLRFSPHFYNTPEELNRTVAGIDTL